jgi:O-antigen ligase
MHDAEALSGAPADQPVTSMPVWAGRFELAALLALFGVAVLLPFTIAAAQSMLVVAVLCWLALVIARRERIEVPRFFWPLAALAALTLVSAAFSPMPRESFIDTKQLVLFVLVPITYRLATGTRGHLLVTAVVSVGAASAAYGIFQYGILDYDDLASRPRGTLGHYMTYSGQLMLIIGVALARVLFGTRDRLWAALVMPALCVAVALTFTRSAWVGACAAAAVLLLMKDFRLIALLPVVAAIFFATAPADLTARFMSMFNMNDPTNRDRVAMLRAGQHMIQAHPFVGVGPNMVLEVYEEYRDPEAVEAVNPHLHNVPLQIAAERGFPALAAWLAFVGIALVDLMSSFRAGRQRVLSAAALAAMVSMLAAGMFEYNFGDSEFLMLFLILITAPFAAARSFVPPRAA